MTTIGVIDYGMGNRRSVHKALERVGATVQQTSDHDVLAHADGLVLPGVGAFPQAMRNLRARGLDELIGQRVAAGTPLLGICLGMQLLFERSTEREGARGLNLLPGFVRELNAAGLPVPHIGWSEARFTQSSPLTDGLPPDGCPFYHVHSLAAEPSDPADVLASSEYGERFATIVARQSARESLFGVQFHPEKSSRHGLELLANFVALSGRHAPARSGAARPTVVGSPA